MRDTGGEGVRERESVTKCARICEMLFLYSAVVSTYGLQRGKNNDTVVCKAGHATTYYLPVLTSECHEVLRHLCRDFE